MDADAVGQGLLGEALVLADGGESAGVALKKQGRDLVGRCPFHDDRTPSLVVTPAKNLWHCLGACRRAGRWSIG